MGSQVAALKPVRGTIVPPKVPLEISSRIEDLNDQITQLEHLQTVSGHHLQNAKAYKLRLLAVRQEAGDNLQLARQDLSRITVDLNDWQVQLESQPGPAASATPLPPDFVPIVMYHETPGNLAEQLQFLTDHGYTSVDLDQVAAALAGGPRLPNKPVVITFDDGFASQWNALPLLEQYHMKATFYIIDGGAGSAFHIGANRKVPDPQGGPDYLTWEQIRSLDRNPLFTVASHTANHLELARQSVETQRYEIIQGKRQLEQQLGHPVRHFAYPYGSYNQTSIQLVHEAGFATAVTTEAGTDQMPGQQLTLHRIRSTLTLP